MSESMRWRGFDDDPSQSLPDLADAIVEWVNANGGEARYVPSGSQPPYYGRQARIAVRTRDGWAYCAPGQRVVMGEMFNVWPKGRWGGTCREFTVTSSDPDTQGGRNG